MTEMLERDKVQMDKVGHYHPDFTRPEVPGEEHYIPLGSYINKAMSSVCAAFTYDFDAHGGAVGTITLGSLPAGVVVTGVIADVLDSVAGGAGITFAVKINGSTIVAATDPTAWTGAVALTTVPKKTINLSSVFLDIAVDDATAGKVRFLLQYVMP